MNVLVVEDEELLLHHLRYQLENDGHCTLGATDGEAARHYLMDYHPDVAIVDLGLPGISGLDLIRQVRSEGNAMPILILTARSNWRDKVDGLNAGADDYLVKPFELEELKARLNALVRRSAGFSQPMIEVGPFSINSLTKTFFVSNEPVSLTAYEYVLMEYMMRNHQKVLSRTILEDQIYGNNHGADSNVLEVLINRLRKKLEKFSGVNPIVTVRGQGYRFDLPCH